MKKIKKLSVVIVALAICMVFTGTVWAQGTSTNMFAPSLDKTTLHVNKQAQTVTLTIAAPSSITVYGVEGVLQLPSGWSIASVSADSLTGFDAEVNVNGNSFLWFAPGETETEIVPVNVQTLFTVTVNVPANTVGTFALGLSSIEYITGIDYENGTVTIADNLDANGDPVPSLVELVISAAQDDEILYGDADGDGEITLLDASLVIQYLSDYDVTLGPLA